MADETPETTDLVPSVGHLDEFEVIEPSGGPFRDVKAGIQQRREGIRATIALSLIAIFALTALGALAAAIFMGVESTTMRGLLEILLPAETALLGSAIGFYFGAESRQL